MKEKELKPKTGSEVAKGIMSGFLSHMISEDKKTCSGKKIYIAGKITGLPYDDVVKKFKDAQIKLEKLGFEVFNPIEISPFVEGKTWDEYMAELLPVVEKCHIIYMLDNWIDSRGAKDERQRAIEKKLVIVYQ